MTKYEKPTKRPHNAASRQQSATVRTEAELWLDWHHGLVRAPDRWRDWYDLEPGEWRFNFEAELEEHHEKRTLPEWTYMYRPGKAWPSMDDFVKGLYIDFCRTAPTPAVRRQFLRVV